jgi:hypothetical protein
MSAICTLFEKDYHFGLATFVNSLISNGFKGVIWAGYKGDIPFWVKAFQIKQMTDYDVCQLNESTSINFVKIHVDKHLTNHKPDFMLDILNIYDTSCDSLLYFDPDIVIKNRWSVFEEWIQWGVLFCEDVNSPINRYHPLRKLWIDHYRRHNILLLNNKDIYVNGGFVALKRNNKSFLEHWKHIQDIMSEELGGLKGWGLKDRTFLFSMTDQDALNIAIMSDENVTILGKDAMDIIHGGYIMSHAIGPDKPWKNKYIKNALSGKSPSATDRLFWSHADSVIKPYTGYNLLIKRKCLLVAILISRFIKRY